MKQNHSEILINSNEDMNANLMNTFMVWQVSIGEKKNIFWLSMLLRIMENYNKYYDLSQFEDTFEYCNWNKNMSRWNFRVE